MCSEVNLTQQMTYVGRIQIKFELTGYSHCDAQKIGRILRELTECSENRQNSQGIDKTVYYSQSMLQLPLVWKTSEGEPYGDH